MQSIVTVSDLSLELPNGHVLFQHLHFSLSRKLTALVGPNGIGKTCLAKMLSEEIAPTDGKIHRHASVIYFPQRELPPNCSVADYLAEDEWSLLREQLLQNIASEQMCTHLSGGQWMRVRLAKKLGNHYLILDEPTNDLDREGRSALLQFLKNFDGGALLISHDRECLRLCDEVLELSKQGIAKYGDGWISYEESKSRERQQLQSQLDTATRERDATFKDRQEQILRQEKRGRRGQAIAERGGMPKILVGARKRRAQVTSGKIDVETFQASQESVRNAHEAFQNLKIDPVMYADLVGDKIPEQKLVVEAVGFNIHFDRWLYSEDLHFTWRGNIRKALKGPNGSGKTALLRAIQGEKLKSRGELRLGGLKSLYIDQKCANLDESLTVFENVREVSILDDSEIRNGLAKFLFHKEAVFQKVATLSGGERLRAALAKGFLSVEKPELLILDEPTNNLDLVNIEFLERVLREFGGALLVISHDEVFLKNAEVTEEFILGGAPPLDTPRHSSRPDNRNK